MDIVDWWRFVEEQSFDLSLDPENIAMSPDFAEPWATDLARASVYELSVSTPRAREILEAAGPKIPDGPWRGVHALLLFRCQVREAKENVLREISDELRRFAEGLPGEQRCTMARTWQLHGVLNVRLGLLDEAERDFSRALELIEDAPARTWILDGFGQVLIGQGAWVEARRIMKAVIESKEKAGDYLGIAVTAGNLARMENSLGNSAEAVSILSRVIGAYSERFALFTRMRLQTLLADANFDAGNNEEAARASGPLLAMLGEAGERDHYLKGYAWLAAAKISSLSADWPETERRLGLARASLTLSSMQALVGYWEARLLPDLADSAEWSRSMNDCFQKSGVTTEAELNTELFLCDRAAARSDRDEVRGRLERALDMARASNNRLWLERVDQAYRRLEPEQYSDRVIERFSGRSAEDLKKTKKADVTIVFADLVNFTLRSVELPPEEVMETVRSLFELSVPLLAEHKVQPVSYLGDGLLAVCEGEGHKERGFQFAMDLVARAGRISEVRRALGQKWGLDIRAGTASGEIVMGVLGSHYKMEYLAIGMITNMAARLQGKAEPGEVMAAYPTAAHRAEQGNEEWLEMKGFTEKVRALRFRAAP